MRMWILLGSDNDTHLYSNTPSCPLDPIDRYTSLSVWSATCPVNTSLVARPFEAIFHSSTLQHRIILTFILSPFLLLTPSLSINIWHLHQGWVTSWSESVSIWFKTMQIFSLSQCKFVTICRTDRKTYVHADIKLSSFIRTACRTRNSTCTCTCACTHVHGIYTSLHVHKHVAASRSTPFSSPAPPSLSPPPSLSLSLTQYIQTHTQISATTQWRTLYQIGKLQH